MACHVRLPSSRCAANRLGLENDSCRLVSLLRMTRLPLAAAFSFGKPLRYFIFDPIPFCSRQWFSAEAPIKKQKNRGGFGTLPGVMTSG